MSHPRACKNAHGKGHCETSHVVWLGLAGLKDWELKPIILEGDWTFVTTNSVDFRGQRIIRAPRDSMQMLPSTQDLFA